MGWDSPDLWHNPEKFGLTIVGDIEWSEPCYSFNTTVVSVDDKGTYYVYSDSGCSCPSPFESFTTLESADLITTNVREVIAKLEEYLGTNDYAAGQVVDLIAKLLQR